MVAQSSAPAPILHYDEAAARRLEALYTHPDVTARRRRVRQALALEPGERVLDIGCGPGFLTAELAQEVGPTGWTCGVDISESGLAMARRRSQGQDWAARTEFRTGDAVALPFADGSFDAAVATQVYEYVADVEQAIAELTRILRPGGRAVVVDTDWETLIWHGGDPQRTARMLRAWDEHLADPILPRTLRPRLAQAGLTLERAETLNILNLEWGGYSAGVAGLVADFVVGRQGIDQQTVDAWLADLRRLSEARAYFFSLDQYLFLATRS